MFKIILSSLTFLSFSLITAAQNTTGNNPDTLYEKSAVVLADDDDKTFVKTEIEAAFPGGESAWKTYLDKNLKDNIAAKNGASAGSYIIIVRFIVARDGKVSDIVPETNFGFGMEKEVIRIIKSGPNWKPAIQNGRYVRAYHRQSVKFVVSGN